MYIKLSSVFLACLIHSAASSPFGKRSHGQVECSSTCLTAYNDCLHSQNKINICSQNPLTICCQGTITPPVAFQKLKPLDTVSPQAFSCEGRENGNYRNPAECRTFYTCSNGDSYLFDCPANLVYNERTDQCDYRQNVAECWDEL